MRDEKGGEKMRNSAHRLSHQSSQIYQHINTESIFTTSYTPYKKHDKIEILNITTKAAKS